MGVQSSRVGEQEQRRVGDKSLTNHTSPPPHVSHTTFGGSSDHESNSNSSRSSSRLLSAFCCCRSTRSSPVGSSSVGCHQTLIHISPASLNHRRPSAVSRNQITHSRSRAPSHSEFEDGGETKGYASIKQHGLRRYRSFSEKMPLSTLMNVISIKASRIGVGLACSSLTGSMTANVPVLQSSSTSKLNSRLVKSRTTSGDFTLGAHKLNFLKATILGELLAESDLLQLAAVCDLRTYAPGQQLYSQSSHPSSELFILCSGEVCVEVEGSGVTSPNFVTRVLPTTPAATQPTQPTLATPMSPHNLSIPNPNGATNPISPQPASSASSSSMNITAKIARVLGVKSVKSVKKVSSSKGAPMVRSNSFHTLSSSKKSSPMLTAQTPTSANSVNPTTVSSPVLASHALSIAHTNDASTSIMSPHSARSLAHESDPRAHPQQTDPTHPRANVFALTISLTAPSIASQQGGNISPIVLPPVHPSADSSPSHPIFQRVSLQYPGWIFGLESAWPLLALPPTSLAFANPSPPLSAVGAPPNPFGSPTMTLHPSMTPTNAMITTMTPRLSPSPTSRANNAFIAIQSLDHEDELHDEASISFSISPTGGTGGGGGGTGMSHTTSDDLATADRTPTRHPVKRSSLLTEDGVHSVVLPPFTLQSSKPSSYPRLSNVVATAECACLTLTQSRLERFLRKCPTALPLMHDALGRHLETSLKQLPFLASLSPPKMKLLVSLFQSTVIEANSVLFEEGDPSTDESLYYFIYSGSVKLLLPTSASAASTSRPGMSPSTRVATSTIRTMRDHANLSTTRSLHDLSAQSPNNSLTSPVAVIEKDLSSGSLFGELGLLLELDRTATAICTSRCILLTLTRQSFRNFLALVPEVLVTFRENLGEYHLNNQYLLRIPIIQQYFYAFCVDEYSTENLDFVRACSKWKYLVEQHQQQQQQQQQLSPQPPLDRDDASHDPHETGDDPTIEVDSAAAATTLHSMTPELLAMARQIYDDFISMDAPHQVNLRSLVVTSVKSSLDSGRVSVDLFSAAVREIYSLVSSDSFARFRKHAMFQDALRTLNRAMSVVDTSPYEKELWELERSEQAMVAAETGINADANADGPTPNGMTSTLFASTRPNPHDLQSFSAYSSNDTHPSLMSPMTPNDAAQPHIKDWNDEVLDVKAFAPPASTADLTAYSELLAAAGGPASVIQQTPVGSFFSRSLSFTNGLTRCNRSSPHRERDGSSALSAGGSSSHASSPLMRRVFKLGPGSAERAATPNRFTSTTLAPMTPPPPQNETMTDEPTMHSPLSAQTPALNYPSSTSSHHHMLRVTTSSNSVLLTTTATD